MERPSKRVRLSSDETSTGTTSSSSDAARPLHAPVNDHERPLIRPHPTRTIDLDVFRRRFIPDNRNSPVRRSPGSGLVPRAPDATITANVIEIAVNDGSAVTQIALPTKDIAIDFTNLGTLTVPGITSHLPTGESSNTLSTLSGVLPSTRGNSTAPTSERTVTLTATSTFHVSYRNGTFIAPSTTKDSNSSITDASATEDVSTSTKTGPVFGEGITYVPSTTANFNTAGLNGVAATTSESSTPTHTKPAEAPALTEQQAQVVGGVVGSVAGVALVLVILLYFLRWYRQRLKSQGRLPEQLSSNPNLKDADHPPSDVAMSQSRQSLILASPFTQSLKRWRTHSEYTVTTNTTSTTAADSEKGFQKVAGRKIPSVLYTGGDGYGGHFGAFSKEDSSSPTSASRHEHTLSRSSFYRDSGGFYSTKEQPTSVSEPGTPAMASFIDPHSGRIQKAPSFSAFNANTNSRDFAAQQSSLANMNSIAAAFAANSSKPEGFAMMRSSPARTPVTQSPNATGYRMPVQAPVTMDADVPEMPLTPPPGIGLGLRSSNERVRNNSQMSFRDGGSPGKFKENI